MCPTQLHQGRGFGATVLNHASAGSMRDRRESDVNTPKKRTGLPVTVSGEHRNLVPILKKCCMEAARSPVLSLRTTA